MSSAVVWGGLVISLLVIILIAALSLKQPGKKKSAKKLKRREGSIPQRVKRKKVISEQVQPKRKKLSAMEENLQKNKVMAQVMIIAKENPELASKVLRQWMKKR